MKPPNILFLLSDQHNALVAGYAGDPYVRTPNLDRLAVRGTVLSNGYCASPLCVPSRMALLSGRYPDATGVFSNNQSLPSDVPTVAHALTLAGYETALCGRMHFVGPDQRHGYTRRPIGDFTATYLGRENPNCGQVWSGTTGQHRRVIEKSGPGLSGVMAYDEAVTAAALAYLRGPPQDQPWFLTVGWYGPHCTYCCPRPLFDYYMDILPPPDCPEDFAATCHPAVRNWMDKRDVLSVDPEAVRRARAAYYGLVELTDRHLGRLLESLDQTGQTGNTLVCYTSDHGDCIGHNGLWWKSNFYEGSARVPCVFAHPGTVRAGDTIDAPTSLLDLAPTFIAAAGADPLPRPDGMALNAQLAGTPAPADRAVLSMLGDRKGDSPSAMIRQGSWKLVDHAVYETPQLFNLETDPTEQQDLGTDPGHAAVRDALRQQLRERWDPAAVSQTLQHACEDTNFVGRWTRQVQPDDTGEFWICPPGSNTRDDLRPHLSERT